MSAKKTITIVGGGLAGLTLGIGLRQRGVPVTLWEAGHYPRHRVCGEFISGRGQATLERLGLRERLMDAGAIPAHTTAFFSPRARSPVRELPVPAWSLSRHVFDATLADEFRRLGGELREGERWRETEFPEGVVRATGRRAQPRPGGWRWFGLKAHARNVELAADLEMHLSPGGYVGLSRLSAGRVNVCGLFRRSTTTTSEPLNWHEILRGAPGSPLSGRLAGAVFEEDSFCSIAGLSLGPQRAAVSHECRVGDTITMIAPVTGNGMSMAFESAEIAMPPLAAFSAAEISWARAQQSIARRCDAAFSRRLAWAVRLQQIVFRPELQDAIVRFAPRWQWLWNNLVARTR